MVTTNFADYHLSDIRDDPTTLVRMCDGILPEIASCTGFPHLQALLERPTFALIQQLVAHAAPNKLLRTNDNVSGVDQETLLSWVLASGAMEPLNRNFYSPHIAVPETFGVSMFNAGTANWILRRLFLGLRVDANTPMLIVGGGRVMGPAEHQTVRTYYRTHGTYPTEAAFLNKFVMPTLRTFGFGKAKLLLLDTTDGDVLWDEVFEHHSQYLRGTIRLIGNAPNTVQAAAQLRGAARRADPSFDKYGDQLFMECDPFPIGRNGDELPAQYQGALSAIGQILRLYLMLAHEAEDIR